MLERLRTEKAISGVTSPHNPLLLSRFLQDDIENKRLYKLPGLAHVKQKAWTQPSSK